MKHTMGARYLHLAGQLGTLPAVSPNRGPSSSTHVHTFPQFRYYVRAPQKISEVPQQGSSTSLKCSQISSFKDM